MKKARIYVERTDHIVEVHEVEVATAAKKAHELRVPPDHRRVLVSWP